MLYIPFDCCQMPSNMKVTLNKFYIHCLIICRQCQNIWKSISSSFKLEDQVFLIRWGDISFSRLIYGRTAYLCIISLVYPDQTSITRQSEIHITGLAPLPQSMTAPHPSFLIGLFLIRCRHSDHTTPPIRRLVC